MVFTPSYKRFPSAFLAALLGMGCAFLSTVQAADRIVAYRDSRGRVIFVNEARPEPSPELPRVSLSTRPPNLDRMIEQAAHQHQVDPNLIRAMVRVESNFNPYAVSSRGARGLMQLIPATARRFGVANIFDPGANLEGGIRYLKYLMEMYGGDLPLALAAYNAGENAVDRHNGVPPFRETRNYLRKISSLYPLNWQSRGSAGIMKFVDSRGIVHFSNTDQP